MRNDKIRAVVCSGWMDNGREQMIQLNGAFESLNEAYGAAYLFLDECANGRKEESLSISLPEKLEGGTGYAMYLKDKDGKITEYAYVLYNEFYNPEE